MTRVVVAGNTVRTRHFIKHALGEQDVEVVALVGDPADPTLGYGFVVDSGAAQFRGTAEIEGGTLVLAGRHGRGGLRHDKVPIFPDVSSALSVGEVDAVVVGDELPDETEADGVRVIRLGTDVPRASTDAAARVIGALSGLSGVVASTVTVVGATNPVDSARDRLLAVREHRGGIAVRPGPDGSVEVLGDLGRVAVLALSVVLEDPITIEAVQRRLRSAGRRELADSVRQLAGPIASRDVEGAAVAVLDLSAVQVSGQVVSVPLFVDALLYEARVASALARGSFVTVRS